MQWFIKKTLKQSTSVDRWKQTSFLYFFSTSAQRENSQTNLLGDLVDPVGGTVAEIRALRVPGPTGEHT